jgi:hypothetical protein
MPQLFPQPTSSSEIQQQKKRDDQIRRAKAAIHLACREVGPYMAVVLLNDALRQQLDELRDEDD